MHPGGNMKALVPMMDAYQQRNLWQVPAELKASGEH